MCHFKGRFSNLLSVDETTLLLAHFTFIALEFSPETIVFVEELLIAHSLALVLCAIVVSSEQKEASNDHINQMLATLPASFIFQLSEHFIVSVWVTHTHAIQSIRASSYRRSCSIRGSCLTISLLSPFLSFPLFSLSLYLFLSISLLLSILGY